MMQSSFFPYFFENARKMLYGLDISLALFFRKLTMVYGNSGVCLSVPKMMIKLAHFLYEISSMARASFFFEHCQT